MKTTYWAMLLMLLPSMAYTQTTEKENEFTMSIQIRPRAEYKNRKTSCSSFTKQNVSLLLLLTQNEM